MLRPKHAAVLACASSFFFAPPPSSHAQSGNSGYNKAEGGFVLMSSDEDFKLKITGRFQPRFDVIAWDDDRNIDDTVTFSSGSSHTGRVR